MSIDHRLAELGITLPKAAAPVASYVPAVEVGGLLHVSGQISFSEDGGLIKGRLGEDMELDAGAAAARRCGIMLLAQIKAALGSLDRVERIAKLGVFVNSAPGFTDQPKVANGASELMQEVFGEAGRHARSAVGVAILPLGVAVEIDAIVAVKALFRKRSLPIRGVWPTANRRLSPRLRPGLPGSTPLPGTGLPAPNHSSVTPFFPRSRIRAASAPAPAGPRRRSWWRTAHRMSWPARQPI
jgi:enamine deaminase RidA (YjgF/YER057c/UK114 family)